MTDLQAILGGTLRAPGIHGEIEIKVSEPFQIRKVNSVNILLQFYCPQGLLTVTGVPKRWCCYYTDLKEGVNCNFWILEIGIV